MGTLTVPFAPWRIAALRPNESKHDPHAPSAAGRKGRGAARRSRSGPPANGQRAGAIGEARREDRTLVAWYRCLYAPHAGGAYDSHHRTAGIAGRTRRCGGCVAACGARAAAGDAGDRVHQRGGPRPMRAMPLRSDKALAKPASLKVKM
jgi:hypothetical protein